MNGRWGTVAQPTTGHIFSPSSAASQGEEAARTTLAVLARVFGACDQRDFAVRLWNGQVWSPAPTSLPRFTLVLNHPGALRRMFLPPTELNLGEAFVRGDFDVEGDLVACAALADVVQPLLSAPGQWLPLGRLLVSLPDVRLDGQSWRGSARLQGEEHSPFRDQQAVEYHYDLPGEFYALFLDQRMQYSCGYFPTGEETLAAAQEAKLDHICRKLRLQPGERLLDIGCGWGGLVTFAAERYGVEAVGITLSPSQLEWARRRVAEAGLAGRCRIDLRDYRALGRDERFDKIVSVGMFEHVGRKQLPTYFRQTHELLKPGGLFLNHGIAGMYLPAAGVVEGLVQRAILLNGDFILRYVFPDAESVPVSEVNLLAEQAGFEERDVESLREHYALTLRHWWQALEAKREQALRLVDEPTYRLWRLYLAGCAHAFDAARLNVYQTLLVKPDARHRSDLPLTREYMYART
jgi:cyclopropane-fatty-acyl-phospholipid synthase